MASTATYISTGAAVGGKTFAILAPSLAGGPIGLAVGAAVAAISALSGVISGLISGCGETCVYATKVVNDAEPYVQQLVAAYFQVPATERTCEFRDWTVQQIDSIFAQVQKLCSSPALGDAGRRCISERFDPSSCAWRDAQGNCWNWVIGYRDPIAKDRCIPASAGVSTAGLLPSLSGLTSGYGLMTILGLATLGFVAWRVRTA